MDLQELRRRLRRAWEAFRADPGEPERRSVIGDYVAERNRQAMQLREDAWFADMERHGEPDTAAEQVQVQAEWETVERPALLQELAYAPITDETRDLHEAAAAWLMADARQRRES